MGKSIKDDISDFWDGLSDTPKIIGLFLIIIIITIILVWLYFGLFVPNNILEGSNSVINFERYQ